MFNLSANSIDRDAFTTVSTTLEKLSGGVSVVWGFIFLPIQSAFMRSDTDIRQESLAHIQCFTSSQQCSFELRAELSGPVVVCLAILCVAWEWI